MGPGPVVRLSSPPGAADGHGGADVPLPGAARQPVYSERMANNDVFAVLADKTRRGILAALKDGERPVGELVAELGVSQPTVSKHLKILREAGMVSMEAQGQRRLYAVQPEPLAEVTDWIHEVVGGASRRAAHAVPAAADAGTEADAAGGTVPSTAAATGTDSSAAVVAAAPQPPVEPVPHPSGAPRRPARGAGSRAAELISSLSGLRRRTRNPRR